MAIFFWFVAYNAIEAFFTLYVNKHLGQPESEGARLLSQYSLIFVLFALPAGFIGSRFGRRKTILTGLTIMSICIFSLQFI
ncbi:MAG: MFS transporter, partial [Anaerolineales bacterium]|nr:MFS transporter [Anaerolineales bacterium]